MKKILLVLAILAGTIFLGQPAVAAEGDEVTEQVTTAPTESEAPPADEQPADEQPADEEAPPAEQQPAPVEETPADAPAPAPDENATPPVQDSPGKAPAGDKNANAPPVEQAVTAAPVKLKICHATASTSNPYVENSPNLSGDLNGHAGDVGPVFVANGPAGWGDIIPPFVFGKTNFPGLNWTTAGQAIYNNGCAPVGQVPVVLTPATAVAPSVTPPTCGADGALVLPQTTGVIYANAPAGTGPGSHTITASAAVGYTLTNPDFEVSVDVLPKLTGGQCVVNGLKPVTAELPTLTDATCSADGTFTLPTTPHVIYLDADFFGTHVVTALPELGYYLTNPNLLVLTPFTPESELKGSQCDSVDVTICHRTNSNVKPYVSIGPDTAGVANGHDTQHEGPVWDPTLKSQKIEWGDIIPPYTYNDVDYPGQNWDATGQLIYANGCQPTTGLATAVTPIVTTTDVCDGGDLPVTTDVAGVVYTFTVGDGITGPWEITATVLNDTFEFADGAQTVFSGDAGDASQCLTPAVTTSVNCDGADTPTPTAIEGVIYTYTVGDGITGPWEITASPDQGYFLADGVQTVFSGDAGDPNSVACIGSGGGGDDPGTGGVDNGDTPDTTSDATPTLDAVREEDGLLPDTGGVPLWFLLLGGSMSAAGIIILMGRRPVVHAFSSGTGPAYSLTLPPQAKRQVTAARPTGLRRVLASVTARIRRVVGRRA